MAQYGYMAKIGMDTSGLQAGLKQINSSLKTTDRELYNVKNSIKSAEKAGTDRTDLLRQKETVLGNAIDETAKKLEQLRSIEERMKSAAGSNNISAEQYREYQRELTNTEAQLRQYQLQLAQTQQEERNMSGSNQVVVSGLQDVQNAYQKVAADIKEFTDALGSAAQKAVSFSKDAVQYSINVGKSFESSMSQVKAYSGAVGDDFTALENAAKDAGATTSKSATEAANALSYMALAGWDTQEMLEGLMPIVRASEAGTADLKRTSDLVTDSMSAMGVATSDLTHYLDICTAAQSNSNTTLTALLEAYVGCGGTLRNLNVPLEESATLLGVLANRGIKASEAGTSLNSILVNLMGANKSAKAAMESLGVSAWDAQGNFIGVTNTLKLLDGALESCTEQQKAFLEAKIGGKTQMDTLQALIAGVREEYDDLYVTLENSQGALMQTSDTMKDNLAGAVTTMKSALEALGVEFYDYLEEPAREAVEAVTEALRTLTASVDKGELSESLKKLSEKFGELIEKLAEFASEKGIELVIDGLSDLVDVLSWCADNIDTLSTAAAGLGAAFLLIKITPLVMDIVALGGAIGSLIGTMAAAETASGALAIAMASIPAVAVGAAIIALGTAIGAYIVHVNEAEAKTARLRLTMDENINSVLDYKKSLDDLEESLADVEKETDRTLKTADNALKSLDDLVDENGNLKDAQADVDEQLKILNETFGLNLNVIDGQIQGYKDLRESYEDYCESLRRNAKLEAMHPAYVEAVDKVEELEQNRDEANRKKGNAIRLKSRAENNPEGFSNAELDEIAASDDFKVWLSENGYKEKDIIDTEWNWVEWNKLNDFFQWKIGRADAGVQAAEANIANNNKIIDKYEKLNAEKDGVGKGKKDKGDDNSDREKDIPKTSEQLQAEENASKNQAAMREQDRAESKEKKAVLKQLNVLKDAHEKGKLTDEQYFSQIEPIINENRSLFDDEDASKSDFWKAFKELESQNKSKSSGSTKDPKQEAERAASAAVNKKKKQLTVKGKKDKSYTEADRYNELEKFAEEELDHSTEAYKDLLDEIEIGRIELREKASDDEKKKAEQSVKDKITQEKERLQELVDKGKLDELGYWQELDKFYNSGDKWDELEKLSDEYQNAGKDIGKNKRRAEYKAEAEQKNKDTAAYTDEYDKLAKRYEDALITEKQYQEELLALKKKYAEKDIDISEHIAEKENEINEKRLDDIKDKYDDLNKEINSRADDIAKGVLGSGKLYEEKDVSGGGKKKIFTDLSKKKQEIEKYSEDLKKLRETNIPQELMDEILAMDYEDRKDIISELLKMNSAKRDTYYSDYTSYHAAAKETAELEFSDEKAAIDEELLGMTDSALGRASEMAKQYGRDAAQAYLDGYNETLQKEGFSAVNANFDTSKSSSGAAEKQQNVKTPENKNGNISVDPSTPIVINVAGEKVLNTQIGKFLMRNRITGGNNTNV